MPTSAPRCSTFIAAAIAIAAVIAPVTQSLAQPFPDRPLRFIVPFPAGGSTDAVARAMQPALEKILGQPVVVENKAGAGGMLGVDAVAKAAPDGLTFGLAGAGALGVNIGERTKRMYDPGKDLAMISRAAESPFILVATAELKASSLDDVVKLAKADPSRISIGHGGNGTAMQLAAQTFVTMAGLKINLVPYRGTAPAVSDAIAGHVQLAIADPPPSMAAIGAGRLKALAVTSKQRFSVFPDVPTFQELGLKDFELTGWFGIVAPGGTPRAIVMRLNAAMVAALKDPEVVRRVRTVGMEPTPTTPEGLSEFLASDIAKAEKLQGWSDKPN
jgi:tripartite-type tricarboxylate transporter receptor subunit TctC